MMKPSAAEKDVAGRADVPAEPDKILHASTGGAIQQTRLIAEEKADYAIDEKQKELYRERLRQKLQDPEFRRIEGFPIGEDDDILALSDPPYYTACPNPFLPEIIEQWQAERVKIRQDITIPGDTSPNGKSYQREPFAADVSEGKGGALYSAHTYHTKVPPKAVMRYILHFTDPGDVIFDGFCGSGMTGVAAQLCGDQSAVEELGYRIDGKGLVYDGSEVFSRLGVRKTILNDLSPAASFISQNYNTQVDNTLFNRKAKQLLSEFDAEWDWMYQTWHPHCDDPARRIANINYTVWSEIFACPHCGAEINFFNVAVDSDTLRVNTEFQCRGCLATLNKRALDRVWFTYFDEYLHRIHRLVRFAPVLINYQLGKHRYEKKPDNEDLELLRRIEEQQISDWVPVCEMLDGERKRKDGYHLKGITHLHHFYFNRPLKAYADIWRRAETLDYDSISSFLRFYVEWSCLGFTKMNRYQPIQFGRKGGSQVNRQFSGTLFVGSIISEVSPRYAMSNKLKRLSRLKMPGKDGGSSITCQSTTDLRQIPDAVIDYIFVDPPFGNNLHYSELNFFWEAWLKILTQREPEAVMDKGRNRTLLDYQHLMLQAFQEIFRVLKPGRWMTVEFHNSQNRVWNAIQEAILRARFVVADVRTLDKKQETYKQSIQGLVKADLVISAYKSLAKFEERFLQEAGSVEGARRFVRQHLDQLPVVVTKDGAIETLSERQDYLLFDRMVAFHIQRGSSVPISASEFYSGLREWFIERDGMFFLPDQVPKYDKARLQAKEVIQLSLFVSDEKSSIQWLRQQLAKDLGGYPQTFQDIQPKFLRQLHQARHEYLPELSDILEENFLKDEQGRWYAPDPYKANDLEKLRQGALLREFNQYRQEKKRLRQFRTEAVRTGFAHAWQNNEHATIVQVAERLPERVLQEDPELLMYYDNACLFGE